MISYIILTAWEIFTTLLRFDATAPHTIDERSAGYHLSLTPLPWVGVLTFQEYGAEMKAGTGVILIKSKIAIGNARDIAIFNKYEWEIIRNYTAVIFLTVDKTAWRAKVENYSLHPEFNEETLTTIGLLFLEYDESLYDGEMLVWPNKTRYMYSSGDIFTIGYTDRDVRLEQVAYRMNYINLTECLAFYSDEKLDSKWMRPKSYHCYNVRFSKDPCVFDPGLALVRRIGSKWTLLGMSTWGPGCALPARFLDFEYVKPWIVSTLPTRRGFDWVLPNKMKILGFWEPDLAEPRQDLDAWILQKIKDNKIILRPLTLANGAKGQKEIVLGPCQPRSMKDGNLIYRDMMNFTSIHKHLEVTGVYGLSMYDLRYKSYQYTCIMVYVECKEKSKTTLSYTTNFQQDGPMDEFIQTVRLGPKTRIAHVWESWKKHDAQIIGSNITNIWFKFKYKSHAHLEVLFYGNASKFYTTTKSPTTTGKNKLTTSNWRRITRTRAYFWGKKVTTNATTTIPTTTIKKIRTTNWWKRWWYHEWQNDPDFNRWYQVQGR